MHYFFLMLVMLPIFAILLANIYVTARHYTARRACYRRASLGSLVRGAKRNALARHYGRV